MMVSVAFPDRDSDRADGFVLTAPSTGGILAHRAHVGVGVTVGVDLMVPDRWCSVSANRLDDVTEPLVEALIGGRATRRLRDLVTAPRGFEKMSRSLAVDPGAALPWIRVAVVDALDRWLQLPLDQSLVDAERGVVRSHAAQTLPCLGPTRSLVIGEALQFARQASGGVVRYLRAVDARRRGLPPGLFVATKRLMAGYGALVDEVADPDRELNAAVDTWRTLSDPLSTHGGDVSAHGPQMSGTRGVTSHRRTRGRLSSMIDPRQVRARVFALSADPAAAEVTMIDAQVGDLPAVVVRVPAYQRAIDQPVVQRLLVRLFDAQSADPRGESLLTVSPQSGGGQRDTTNLYFEGIVPLRGSTVGALRADVFDALSDVPPVSADTDQTLQEVRRAAVLLSEWRHLLAVAQLPGVEAPPARCLRALAKMLATPAKDIEEPLFAGGPSAAGLRRLAATGDREILRRARSLDSDEGATGLFGVAHGSGGLLVAELAAAHPHRAA